MSADVQVVTKVESKEDLLKLFEQEVEDFSQWMEKNPRVMQQGALTRPERVLLLTYLMQKHAGNIDAKRYGPEKT